MKYISFLLIMIPTLAFGANMNFFNDSDSAVRFFTDQDWKLFDNATEDALNQGKKVSWKNPQSGSHGIVIPLNKSYQNGVRCRDLKIVSVANNRTDNYTFTFCKYGSEWKLSS